MNWNVPRLGGRNKIARASGRHRTVARLSCVDVDLKESACQPGAGVLFWLLVCSSYDHGRPCWAYWPLVEHRLMGVSMVTEQRHIQRSLRRAVCRDPDLNGYRGSSTFISNARHHRHDLPVVDTLGTAIGTARVSLIIGQLVRAANFVRWLQQ